MKLGYEVVKVLVASVDMGFRSNGHHLEKVKKYIFKKTSLKI